MEITQVNTIFDYETKTQKGNTYRRSNIGTNIAALGIVARESATLKDLTVIKAIT